ncbi:hypothetical protein ACFV9C_42225 [Kribbella sp. NPDC059898]|uniref:hypothetical protein n=1 Tax=Kribbella sp. NPDC059898 TaxID=3346995 RepID=UPI0036549703
MNIADPDNWKIHHLLDKTSLKWVLAVALERHDEVPELDPPLRSGDRHRAAIELHDTQWAILRDLIDKYDLDSVLRSVLLRAGKLKPLEYDTVHDMFARATAELELIDLPENPMPPVTITEVANESREQVSVELTLSMSQEQSEALDEVFPPWASGNVWATRYANLTGEDALQLHDWLDTVEYAVHLLRSGSLKLDGNRDPATLQALDACIKDLVIGLQPRFEGVVAALYLARNTAGGSWVELAKLTGTASTTLQSRVKKIQADPQWVDWATGAQSPDADRHPVVLHTPQSPEPSAPGSRRRVQAATGTTAEDGRR